METITVTILPGGKKAKEVNPLGKEPIAKYIDDDNISGPFYSSEYLRWQSAEDKLRTFDIDFSHLDEPLKKLVEAAGGNISDVSHVSVGYEPGDVKQAQIINETKIRIV